MTSLWNKAKAFFIDHINWCHKTNSDGTEKEPTLFYDLWCALFWPIPWMDEPCWCCASVRGVIYGILLGVGISWIFGG